VLENSRLGSRLLRRRDAVWYVLPELTSALTDHLTAIAQRLRDEQLLESRNAQCSSESRRSSSVPAEDDRLAFGGAVGLQFGEASTASESATVRAIFGTSAPCSTMSVIPAILPGVGLPAAMA
jgi:hypothetical protein